MSNTVGNISVDLNVNEQPGLRQLRDFARKVESTPLKLALDGRAFIQPLGRITGELNDFDKSLRAANARVFAFGASASILFSVAKALKEVVNSTIEVEKSLTDINVILNTTQSKLKEFSNGLFDIARNTGQSFQEVAKAATEFSRQGLTAEQTLKRTKDALVLTRLSGMDAAESVEAITAALNSFNDVGLDSTKLINKLANVDAAFAVSSRDLAEAIKRVGSTAQGAGVGLNELIALVTSAQQTTARGGAVIGNAFKTIFTKVQTQDVLDTLNQVGISIKDVSGEALPAITILENLAKGFDRLSSAQQNEISKSVGGLFQINILKATLKDLGKEYSIYNGALKTAADNTEAAIQRNEELNESLSALLQRTGTNFKQLGSGFGNDAVSPFLKVTLKSLNSALESKDNNLGDTIGKGLIKGIGSSLTGPALTLALSVLLKLMKNFVSDALVAGRSVLDLDKKLVDVSRHAVDINRAYADSARLVDSVNNHSRQRLETEQQILRTVEAQGAAYNQVAKEMVSAANPQFSTGFRGNSMSQFIQSKVGPLYDKNLPVTPSVFTPEGENLLANSHERQLYKKFVDNSPEDILYDPNRRTGKNRYGAFVNQRTNRVVSNDMAAFYGLGSIGQDGRMTPNSGGFQPAVGENLNELKSAAALQLAQSNISEQNRFIGAQNTYQRVSDAVERQVQRENVLDKLAAYRGMNNMPSTAEYYSGNLSRYPNLLIGGIGRSQRDLIDQQILASGNPELMQGLSTAKMARSAKIQNAKLGASLALPILGGVASEMIGTDSKGARMGGAGVETLTNVASFALQGSVLGGGPIGAAIGGGMGLLISLPKLIQSFTDNLPELQKRLEGVRDETARTSEALAGYVQTSEKLSGNGLKKSEIALLQSQQRDYLNKLSPERRNELTKALQDKGLGSLGELQQKYLVEDAQKEASAKLAVSTDSFFKKSSLFNEKLLVNDFGDFKGKTYLPSMGGSGYSTMREVANYGQKFNEGGTKEFEAMNTLVAGFKGSSGSSMLDVFVQHPELVKILQNGVSQKNSTYAYRALGKAADLAGSKEAKEFYTNLSSQPESMQEPILKALGEMFNPERLSQITKNEEAQKATTENFNKSLGESAVNLFNLSQALLKSTQQIESETALKMESMKGEEGYRRAVAKGAITRTSLFSGEGIVEGSRYQEGLAQASADRDISQFAAQQNYKLTINKTLSKINSDLTAKAAESLYGKDKSEAGLKQASSIADSYSTYLNQTISGENPEAKLREEIKKLSLEQFSPNLNENRAVVEEKLKSAKELLESLQNAQFQLNLEIEISKKKYEEVSNILKVELRDAKDILAVRNVISSGNFLGSSNQSSNIYGSALKNRVGASSGYLSGSLQGLTEQADFLNSSRSALPPELRAQLVSATAQQIRQNLSASGLALQNGQTPESVAAATIAEKYKTDLPQLFATRQASEQDIVELNRQIVAEKLKELRYSQEINFALEKQNAQVADKAFDAGIISGAEYRRRTNASQDAAIDAGQFSVSDLGTSLKASLAYNTKDYYRDLKDGAYELGDTMKSSFKEAFKEFITGAKNAKEALRDLGIMIASKLLDRTTDMAFNALFGGISSLTSSYFSGMGKANGGEIKGYSYGGKVNGGSGVRDDVPAMLTSGEFVVKRSAVQKYGEHFLNHLNSGGVVGYADGGVTTELDNRFQRGKNLKKPTNGKFFIDPRLSNFALSNDESSRNVRRNKDEQALTSYLEEKAQYDRQVKEALEKWKEGKHQRIIGAYISAAIGIAGAGLGAAAKGMGNGAATAGGATSADYGYDNTMVGTEGTTSDSTYNTDIYDRNSAFDSSFGSNIGSARGGIRYYARGGNVFGGDTHSDTVPAMLMGGEFVVRKSAVDKHGVEFFNKINNMNYPKHFADGGYVGEQFSGSASGSSMVNDTMLKLIESIDSVKQSFDKKQDKGEKTASKESGENGMVNHISISINMSKDGKPSTEVKGSSEKKEGKSDKDDAMKSQKFGELINSRILQTIIEQKRPGGLLADS